MKGIKERLDAEAVTRGKQQPLSFVPQNESKFSAQSVQALHTNIFVKMQSDFAVRAGSEPVPSGFQFALNGLKTVKLAIDDDVSATIFARDRLVAGRQINDAEA